MQRQTNRGHVHWEDEDDGHANEPRDEDHEARPRGLADVAVRVEDVSSHDGREQQVHAEHATTHASTAARIYLKERRVQSSKGQFFRLISESSTIPRSREPC